jgi:hypothetical protein
MFDLLGQVFPSPIRAPARAFQDFPLSKMIDVSEYRFGYQLGVHRSTHAANGYGVYVAESSAAIRLGELLGQHIEGRPVQKKLRVRDACPDSSLQT